jgi:hypothetical protein
MSCVVPDTLIVAMESSFLFSCFTLGEEQENQHKEVCARLSGSQDEGQLGLVGSQGRFLRGPGSPWVSGLLGTPDR